jgi:hypothetical protein
MKKKSVECGGKVGETIGMKKGKVGGSRRVIEK